MLTFEQCLDNLSNELKPDFEQITTKILHNFPNKSLEEIVAYTLEAFPNVINKAVEQKKGRADFGADIIFEYRNEIINTDEKVAVQAKAYEGTMGYKKAIEDIRKAFETDSSFTQGLIIGTALSITDEFKSELQNLRDEFQKPIGIVIGSDFAEWILKSSHKLLGRAM